MWAGRAMLNRRRGERRDVIDDRPDRPESNWPPSFLAPLDGTSRSCCCPAAPVLQVLFPPASGHGAMELLLCRHHYRTCSDALSPFGVALYDDAGRRA
jgi:hypothetical protein